MISEETREKLRKSHLGKPSYWKGKKRPEIRSWLGTPEVIAKFSATKKGKMPKALPSLLGYRKTHPVGKGEAHPRWVGDRSLLKTERRQSYDTKSRIWAKEVKDRDGWKCQMANGNCSGRLEAHHILPWREYENLRYQINNGIALCRFHHPLKRADEGKTQLAFQKLIADKVPTK